MRSILYFVLLSIVLTAGFSSSGCCDKKSGSSPTSSVSYFRLLTQHVGASLLAK